MTKANNQTNRHTLLPPEDVRALFDRLRLPEENTEQFAQRIGISRRAYNNYLKHGVWAEVSQSARLVLELANQKKG